MTTGNRAFAEGGPLALRYFADVAPFGAVAERTDECFSALVPLVPAGGRVALQTFDPFVPSAPFVIDRQAPLFQMVLDEPMPNDLAGPEPIELDGSDVPDMMTLADKTHPGPFGPRTIELGRYIGIRSGGVLTAMAGERMRFDRFVEISAVCVDPASRGQGLAAVLMTCLARHIQDQALTPFLHVFESNAVAIALYKKLGFVIRRHFHITSLRVAAADT